MNRLLPWTGEDGRPCYLSTDGAGPMSRLADRIELVQLGLAGRLLDRAQDVPAEAEPAVATELGLLVAPLTRALRDALLIAESRGARLAFEGVHAMPPVIEVAHDALAHCPTASQALALLSLPGRDLASAGAARRYVQMAALSWGLPRDTADALGMITGELAANAVEHSASLSVTVALSRTASAVVISVTDEGQECASVPPAPAPEQEHGRGLLIVDTLAARWGQRHTRTGLTVWAEIAVEQ